MSKVPTLLRVLTFGAALLLSAPVYAQPDDVIRTVQDDAVGTVQDDDDDTDYGWIGLLGLAGLAGLLRRRDTHDRRDVR